MPSRKKKREPYVPTVAGPPANALTGPEYVARLASMTVSSDAHGSWRFVVDGDVVRSEPA